MTFFLFSCSLCKLNTCAIYQNLTKKYKTKTVFWDSKQQALSQFSCIKEKSNKHLAAASQVAVGSDGGRGGACVDRLTVKTKPIKLFTPHFRFPRNRKLGFGEKFRTPVNC